MTAPDPLDPLLGGLRVPAMPASLADRIVAEAARPERVPALTPAVIPRRRIRRWTRRGVWTTVLAVNLVLASAVAAAIGGGVIQPHRIVAAMHRIVEHIRHPHGERALAHHAPAAVVPHRLALAAPRPIAAPRAAPAPVAAPAFAPGDAAVPPIRASIPRPPMRIAAVARPHAERPMERAMQRQMRRDAVLRERRAEHLTQAERPRRPLADRPAPITAPPIRAETPPVEANPIRAEAGAAGFTPRWQQRGWRQRGWRNRGNQAARGDGQNLDTRRGDADTEAGIRQQQESPKAENPKADGSDRGPQRGAGRFRQGGRRFGGGGMRPGGGGRRRR